MPAMLRIIIADVLDREPDIVITSQSSRHEDCLREARGHRADIVVTQDGPGNRDRCLEQILAHPPLAVFVLSPDGGSASGISLARRPIALGRENAAYLAEAIRRMAAELST
ncbi:MAG: hypothetical protein J7500_14260 [Sphingomonas sp.]|uniref:hypothetical protein n=1 Tax=Sphingomonas sp. TaxID=28214 RepID=UPI001B2BE68E|nr:hypothetical protein [Sphingomonas sp.]MBO9623868.1 hypothetical protein [Sphingomonas sp.]